MSGLVTVTKLPLLPYEEPPQRPHTRADCKDGPRPCPWIGCRHHLGNDEHGGIVRLNVGRLSGNALPTCSLDVAEATIDGKPQILDVEQIAGLTGLWHTNVEDALASGMAKLEANPELLEAWLSSGQEGRGHALALAQQWAEPNEETPSGAIRGRPPGLSRNGG